MTRYTTNTFGGRVTTGYVTLIFKRELTSKVGVACVLLFTIPRFIQIVNMIDNRTVACGIGGKASPTVRLF